jgi:hypothetical protein
MALELERHRSVILDAGMHEVVALVSVEGGRVCRLPA